MIARRSTGLGLTAWAILLAPSWTSAQDPDSIVDLSAQLEGWLDTSQSPGLATAVARDDGLVAEGAAGLRQSGGDEPIDIDDRFHIGACTKAISTSIVALLVHEELLSWDMRLEEALPRLNATMDAGFAGRTLLELCRDRAGAPALSRGNEALWVELQRLGGSPMAQREELTRRVLSAPPEGNGFLYSNTSVPIAMAVCESWSGLSWEELMASRIFGPLGFESGGIGWPANNERRDQPLGHVRSAQGLQPLPLNASEVLPPSLAPAGEAHCSAGDLALFGAWHLAGLRGVRREGIILEEDEFRVMHDHVGQGYAMGWIPRERGDRLISSAMGTTGAFFAVLIVDAPRNVCVAVCANSGAAQPLCEEIAELLLDEFGPLD